MGDKNHESQNFDIKVLNLSLTDKIAIKFAEDTLNGRLDLIREFARQMVSLSSGLIPVYFGILKFISDTSSRTQSSPVLSVLVSTWLILSLYISVRILMPTQGTIIPEDLTSIKEFQEKAIKLRYQQTQRAMFCFIMGMALMIVNFIYVLYI